jgi:hypothetical protein
LHHHGDINPLLHEANRLLKVNGIYIFSFANKRNAKHRLLSLFGRSDRRVGDLEPVPIGKNIYNFHPGHIDLVLNMAGFKKEAQLGVGSLRNELLGRLFSSAALVKVDALLQSLMGSLSLSPSIFVRARKV